MTLKIALDFDDTYTAAPTMWDDFIASAKDYGHDVRIVTYRKHTMTDPALDYLSTKIPVIYTEYIQKRPYCQMIGWEPDIWIDDSPEFIVAGNQHVFGTPHVFQDPPPYQPGCICPGDAVATCKAPLCPRKGITITC